MFRNLCIAAAATLAIGAFNAQAEERTYVVQPGDSLSEIAAKFYGAKTSWLPLLNANRDIVREKGGLIFAGTTLRIPDLNDDDVTKAVFQQASVADKPMLELVTGDDFAPFTDESLPEGGLFTEIVKEAFGRAGFQTQLEFLPWDYGLRATKKATFMASFPWYHTEERAEDLWYSAPVYDVLILAFFAKGAPIEFTSVDDLNGLIFCRPEGYFLDDVAAKIEEGLIVHVAPKTPEDCFNKLVSGEVDVVSLNEITGNGAIASMGISDQVEPAGTPVAIRSLHIVYPKFHARSRGVAAKVDLALKEMEGDETIQQIIERHLKLHYAQIGS